MLSLVIVTFELKLQDGNWNRTMALPQTMIDLISTSIMYDGYKNGVV